MRCAVTLLCDRLQNNVGRQLFNDAAGRTPQETAPRQVILHNQDRIVWYADILMLLTVHEEQNATSQNLGSCKRKSGLEKMPLRRREHLKNSEAAGRRPQETARTGCHMMLRNQEKIPFHGTPGQ